MIIILTGKCQTGKTTYAKKILEQNRECFNFIDEADNYDNWDSVDESGSYIIVVQDVKNVPKKILYTPYTMVLDVEKMRR